MATKKLSGKAAELERLEWCRKIEAHFLFRCWWCGQQLELRAPGKGPHRMACTCGELCQVEVVSSDLRGHAKALAVKKNQPYLIEAAQEVADYVRPQPGQKSPLTRRLDHTYTECGTIQQMMELCCKVPWCSPDGTATLAAARKALETWMRNGHEDDAYYPNGDKSTDIEIEFWLLWSHKFPTLPLEAEQDVLNIGMPFDFLHKPSRTVFEVQGGTFRKKGAHNTAPSITRDARKSSLAQMSGWRCHAVTEMGMREDLDVLDLVASDMLRREDWFRSRGSIAEGAAKQGK